MCLCSVAQFFPTLFDPMDCSQPGSSVHRIPSQEYQNELPFSTPGYISDPGIEPESLVSPELAGEFFVTKPPGNY